ncbi:transcriptional regulator [Acetobacter tropicalis NRIC 0312]|jgi:phage repressor protein C with HTH and peptisase S24 domain|uniref:Repressor n=1 Tax=Acetobacter tropicalis TaxID=104102 RepID=A0A511FPH7_9PROT|nr:S24 family peptidase [Acetobacter tropicalis]KXV48682.1 transcriptional regulator [Acetobacter tropicalis]GAL97882.1 transcriptional regulator [Acetobacter tropicalis]GBR67952.1 transcriptional regulator [Acetobacter tropicalis NRIC 0312]GEL50820.1 repressor [Acetobacter tropicalis]
MTRSPVAEELERRMALLGLTQKALARNAGVGDTYVRDILKGKSRNPGGEKLERIAAMLGCTARDLLFPAHARMMGEQDKPARYSPPADMPSVCVELNPPGYVAVPFISLRAGMGGGGYVEDQLLGRPKFFEEEFVRGTLRAHPADLRVIEVEGQSMEPMLKNGDMVLVDTRKVSIIEPGIFVLFDGDGVVCKWVERAHEASEPMIRIKSENPRFSPYEVPADLVQIIGRVVWFARRL